MKSNIISFIIWRWYYMAYNDYKDIVSDPDIVFSPSICYYV